MIDSVVLWTYVAIVAGFVFVPGPATVLTVARSSTSGTRAGLATALGIAVGDFIHTAFAVIGLSALVLASAWGFTVIKYLGAAYLVYLGIRALLANPEPGEPRDALAIGPLPAFRQAIVAEVLNPKTAMFFLAFLPQFVDPTRGMVAGQLAVFGVLLVLLGLLSTVVFAVVTGALGGALRQSPVVQRWQSRVVGTIYCALGVRLALQEK